MAQIETWLKCDLRKTVEVVPLKGHLFSADVNGNRIGVEITDRGVPHPVSGSLVCYGLRNDGVTVVTRVNVSNNSRPSVVLAHDFYDVIGPIQIVLRLVDGSDETVLAACSTYVYKSKSGTLIDSGSAFPDIESIIARIDDCERAATAANTAASNAQAQVDAAQQAASAAQTAAQTASSQASNAASDASAAQTAAATAQAAAASAASDAHDAEVAAAAAQSAAQIASTQATNAANSAATAQAQVATAQQAASSAAANISAAQASAARAQESAIAAQSSAAAAATSAATAAAEASTAAAAANSANNTANGVSAAFSNALPSIVQGGEVRNNALFLLNGDGEIVAGPFSGFGGGGGGGGGGYSGATLTFASSDGNYAFNYRIGDTVVIDMTWSSLEDDEPTGNGTLKLTIDGVVKYQKGVPQGTIHEDVTSYLQEGANTLVFRMTDAYGNGKSKSFSINLLNIRITSSFDDSADQHGPIEFPYVPYGNLQKTVHFIVDGTEVATNTISSYGRLMTQAIPAQSHGAHVLTVYYTGTLNGDQVTSNILHYEILCITPNEDDVIIASSFNTSEVDQYSTINIPYRVYTPGSQLSDVTIQVNGVTVNSLTGVDRTQQQFSYRLDTAGSTTISITSGNAVKIILITVNAVTIGAVAETEGLKLYLSSYGRNNLEANPAVWESDQNGTQVSATFSGFNWVSDGWLLDDDGVTALRVSGDARVTIPYKPFATDKRTTGFTIEIDFATKDVRNYDSPILSCMYNGRGIQLTSQRCELHSEGSTINMQFKEEEHVRVSFVVEKRTEQRLIYCYINGILSGVTQYPSDDNFQQSAPQNITIGSSDATIDIYTIRVYDLNLSIKQVENNWIADTPDGEEMLTRFAHNNVRNESDEIVISKLPNDLPYMVIACEELPQFKGDKKTCSGAYVDPVHADRNFTFENCQIDVQGTSSQYYARKNYKMKFNNGFTNSNGNIVSKYALREGAIPVKTFCMKADVASSEGANNVELVRLYNDVCPYKTPAQLNDSRVRQGIDGFPIVIFWNNTTTNDISFLGKYNFNNDKSTEDVYGFVEGDESWEMRNSGSNRVLYKDDSFSHVKDTMDEFGNMVSAWQKDFECRYPDDEYEDYTQLQEFIAWVKSTDTTQATNAALAETADFGETITTEVNGQLVTSPVTYTHDTAAYRLAKFRAQLHDYVEVDSALFYYLFTEVFLMIDSRAKNSFPSFMGATIASAEETNE